MSNAIMSSLKDTIANVIHDSYIGTSTKWSFDIADKAADAVLEVMAEQEQTRHDQQVAPILTDPCPCCGEAMRAYSRCANHQCEAVTVTIEQAKYNKCLSLMKTVSHARTQAGAEQDDEEQEEREVTDRDNELRRLAEAATPETWHFWHGRIATDIDKDGGVIIAERPKHSGGKYQAKVDANFTFIAAANPSAILSLLDRLEAVEAAFELSEKTCRDLTEKVIPNIQREQAARGTTNDFPDDYEV